MKSYEEVMKEFKTECEEISALCVKEGYPAHGSNYDLRVEGIYKWYAEKYPEYFGYDYEKEV